MRVRTLSVALVAALASAASGQTILPAHPGPANNGGSPAWAIFFDVKAGGSDLLVTAMRSANTGAAGAAFSVEVLTRPGTSLSGIPAPVGAGPGSSPAGWTSLGTVPAVQGPVGSSVSEVIDIPDITVPAGATVGVAVRFNVVGPRYFGTGTPAHSVFSDSAITLTTGEARSVPFTTGGTAFASRALVGELHYTVSGESCDVLDFQSLEQNNNGANNQGYQYDEDGYRFTKVNSGPEFATFGTAEGRYPGSTALYNNQIDGVTTLRRIDGRVFNITSIDLSNLNGSGPAPVTFTGFYPGGGSVVLATNTGDPNGLPNTLQTIDFPNTFCGLERLEWTQVGPFHQFDNLHVATPTRLDFQSLEQVNGNVNAQGYQYDEDGYRLTKVNSGPQFGTFGTLESRYPGSTALFNDQINGVTTLQRVDGAPFDICEIKLANLNGAGPANVNFVGTLAGGGVVNHNTNTGDPNGLPNTLNRNIFPPSFRGLSKLEWTQEGAFHQFDDLIVACSNVSAGCPCACDYDLTTGPNLCDIFDFLAFQNGYDAGDPCSCDKDVSTGPGVCDIFDFLAFQNEYDTGCP